MIRRQLPKFARAASRRRHPGSTVVSPCRCAGGCRCGGVVQALLLMEIERDCEFFRDVP